MESKFAIIPLELVYAILELPWPELKGEFEPKECSFMLYYTGFFFFLKSFLFYSIDRSAIW